MVTAKLAIRRNYKTGGGYILSALSLDNKIIKSNWFKSHYEASCAAKRIQDEYKRLTGQPLSLYKADINEGLTEVRT